MNCITCLKGKFSKLPFKEKGNRATYLFELVNTDLCGQIQQMPIGGSRYMLLFIDDFSRKVFTYFLKRK